MFPWLNNTYTAIFLHTTAVITQLTIFLFALDFFTSYMIPTESKL